MALAGGCRAAGGGPVSGVARVPCPRRAVGGTPCNQAGIPGLDLSEVWGQESWGRAWSLPVLGAGSPGPSALGRELKCSTVQSRSCWRGGRPSSVSPWVLTGL